MEVMSDYSVPLVAPRPFSERVKTALEDQGRSKSWLAEFLDISRRTLYIRLAENSFKDEEIRKLKSELGI